MRLLRTIAVVAALLAAQAGPALATETTLVLPGGPPKNDPAVLDAARAKVAAGDTKGAIAGLAPYVADHPQDVAAGRLLGDLYFRVPDYAKAEKIWKALIAFDPGDRETHGRLGALYAVQDRINESMSEFQLSLPNRAGYVGLVMIHKKVGDLTEYLAGLRTETELHPFNLPKWSELGQAERALHHYAAALDAFNHVAGIRPQSCAARVDLANALVDLGRIDPAIVHLKACIAVDPSYYAAVVNLGEAYLEKSDPVTARPLLDRALTLHPEGSEALVDIGYTYDMKGDWKTAVGYYNRAIRSDPLRPEAYIDLGYDYSEQRLFPLAEAAYLKGLAVAQDDGRLHYMLAVTYNVQGKVALARDQYRFAINSDEPVIVRQAEHELALLPPK
ncbi:MAG: tetratricopeptide repeat protein [Candidatus Eremiobacteraeota bacterium]|nr:tetratricopeptide repeat protein [Candidatus Eremiobacteraeota bacterium]